MIVWLNELRDRTIVVGHHLFSCGVGCAVFCGALVLTAGAVGLGEGGGGSGGKTPASATQPFATSPRAMLSSRSSGTFTVEVTLLMKGYFWLDVVEVDEPLSLGVEPP
jgi:hypothetical protein